MVLSSPVVFDRSILTCGAQDVERIAALPFERRAESGRDQAGAGPGEGEEKEMEEEVVPLVSADCWVFEHLRYGVRPRGRQRVQAHALIGRRLCCDLTLWVVYLQKECSRETCPDMRAADWLYICATHATEAEVRPLSSSPTVFAGPYQS